LRNKGINFYNFSNKMLFIHNNDIRNPENNVIYRLVAISDNLEQGWMNSRELT